MKKSNEVQKKLSLKKMQLMKVSEMKTINGGSLQMNFNTGGDEPPTLVPQGTSISVRS